MTAIAPMIANCAPAASVIAQTPRGTSAKIAPAPSPEAIALRNLGLAQLENEQAHEATLTFRRLIQIEDRDPLGYANIAVALLRQQETGAAMVAIGHALERAPGRPDLLLIQADILAWGGEAVAALPLLRTAAESAPADPEILYSLIRHAETVGSDAAQEAAAWADARLAQLRPENLVVLLRIGQRAIAAGDRAAATAAYTRIRELLWQVPPAAAPEIARVFEALAAGDLARARVPGLRLANLLRATPIHKSSLVELNTGIQGIPVERFAGELPNTAFGDGVEVSFVATRIDDPGLSSFGLAVVDLDGDQRPDIVRTIETAPGSPALEIRNTTTPAPLRIAAGAHRRLLAVDLDNDGHLDLLAFGGANGERTLALEAFRGQGDGRLVPATKPWNLEGIAALSVDALDYDSEGDLDLALALGKSSAGLGSGVELVRNNLETPFERALTLEPVGGLALPRQSLRAAVAILATDLDRDGDIDLLVGHAEGVSWLDNLRQGRFRDRSSEAGLSRVGAARLLASADLDLDGWPELVTADSELRILSNHEGVFEVMPDAPRPAAPPEDIVLFDADNDGRLDLAIASARGVQVFTQRPTGWSAQRVTGLDAAVRSLKAADLDADGDLDLVAATDRGLYRLENQGGNRNHWLTIRLQGLNQGSDKNNFFGRGAVIEVRAGRAYEYREVRDPVTHLGLGSQRRADSVRVIWNNGVPQHRLNPAIDQPIVEEQVLKGSCPYLYAWNGTAIEFVTDLLWGAPLGMPVAPGAWASSDPVELVRVDGAVPQKGFYDLRITEELWEAAYFDSVELWVVDHPIDTEAASSLRIFPGAPPPGGLDDEVRLAGEVRPVAGAWDGTGADVTMRIAARDDIYADGYPVGDYQGIAARPWAFTFELGEAPGRSVRLLLDGWIFPADASLNLAAAQRLDLDFTFTRLEVETAAGWQTLLDPMGFPAGKTKTLVIDTPPLPEGARRLRITTSRWLHWDRIAWSLEPRDREAQVISRLAPSAANLGYRGFSRVTRSAPNAPHHLHYGDPSTESPWLPFPGRYTRYGDVRELLLEADDRLVILAAGDEMQLSFPAADLPAVAPGMRRTLFLRSEGWDKDADRNTYQPESAEPLPFRAMSGYPYAEPYPDTPELRRYRDDWLTRVVAPALPGVPSLSTMEPTRD